jgi:ABC-type nitrate/sulfonate/bicarbonate transport system substrate-binding protein
MSTLATSLPLWRAVTRSLFLVFLLHARCAAAASPPEAPVLQDALAPAAIRLGGGDEASESPVRLAGVVYLGDLPTLIADERGLFERAGVDAAVTYGRSGKENLARLRAGDVDFALMALTPAVLDLLGDSSPGGREDPVIMASLVHSGLLNKVVTLRRSELDRMEELAGRRVGLMAGTNAEVAWWIFSAYHGFAPDAVEVLDLPVDALTDALLAGTVDAAVLWEPWASRLASRVPDGINVLAGSDLYVAKWILVTRRGTVAARPALCRALLRAYQEAIGHIQRHPVDALRTYARKLAVDAAPLAPESAAAVPFYALNLDWSLVSSLQQQLAWARAAGYERDASARSVMQLIAPGPLKAVDRSAVTIPAATPGTRREDYAR